MRGSRFLPLVMKLLGTIPAVFTLMLAAAGVWAIHGGPPPLLPLPRVPESQRYIYGAAHRAMDTLLHRGTCVLDVLSQILVLWWFSSWCFHVRRLLGFSSPPHLSYQLRICQDVSRYPEGSLSSWLPGGGLAQPTFGAWTCACGLTLLWQPFRKL